MTEPTDYMYEMFTNSTDDYPILSNWCNMDDISKFSAMFTSVLYSLIFLFSLLGNSLVLWVIIKYENLSSLTNLFILNLCITDLAFSFTLPFWAVYHYYGWIFGEFLCKAVSAIFSISYYGGVIFLTIMTILRHLAVADPLSTLRTQTKNYGMLVSMAVWTSSILVVVPEMIYTQVKPYKDGRQNCEYKEPSPWKLVELSQQVIFFLCSFIIISICYIKMLRILLRSRSQRRHRTVRLIFAIVVVFFLSWAPYNVLGLVYDLSSRHVIKLHCQLRKEVFFAFDISRKVAYCHCCLNPVLYVFVGVKFRRHLKLLFKQYSLCHSRIPPSSPKTPSFHIGPYEDASMY
ncbi:chemokine XC receptor 1 [Elgaria multicarinata webbii]|uniref:chemokine XC receptor 1 n=1 Tax=Elgaria multicarinata webbii TaxID=159646 RepID=UPI002FCD5702